MGGLIEGLPQLPFSRSNRGELSGALDQLNVGVYLTDMERRIVFWNRKAEEITGYGAGDVEGRACDEDFLAHVDQDGNRLCATERCPLQKSIAQDSESNELDLVYARKKDGRRVAVSVSTAPVRDAGGRVVGGIAAFRDETVRVRDLEFARLVQQNILPEMLAGTDTFRLDVHHHPRGLVGGDYYNVTPLEGNRYGILTADVRGQGVSSALYTMLLHTLEEKLAHKAGDPSSFISGLNMELARYMVDDSFTTGVYAVLDTDHWILSHCSAGHPPLLHYHAATGTVDSLEAGGLPLGILEAGEFRTNETVLEPGDLVLFYTDGLTESQGSATRPVGEEGLAELLRQEIMDTSMDLPKRLYDRVLAFTGEDSLDDDALVLSLLRRRPDSGDTLSVDALRELVSW